MKNYILIFIILFSACFYKRVNLKEFETQDLKSINLKSVSIIPLNDTRLLSKENKSIDNIFYKAFINKNPNIKAINPNKFESLIYKNKLYKEYIEFCYNYRKLGIINRNFLIKIKRLLNFDAIFIGKIVNINKEDRESDKYPESLSLTLIYSLINCENNKILWEAKSNSYLSKSIILKFKKQGFNLYTATRYAIIKIITKTPILFQD